MSSRKSEKQKDKLKYMFNQTGYSVISILENFSSDKSPLPDLVVGNGNVFYAIDIYTSGRDRIYIQEEDFKRVEKFASFFGAKPRVGIKFDRENWRFFSSKNLYKTENGNYRIKKENGQEYESFYDLIGYN